MSAPVITKQPQPQSVTPGSNVVFIVRATGAVSYQWKRDNVNVSGGQYSGETTNTLTLTAAEAADAGVFKCAVTNGDGTTTSSEANLAVYSPEFDPAPSTVEPAIIPFFGDHASNGSPEGVYYANRGDYRWDFTNNVLYVKDSLGYTNTGWVASGSSGSSTPEVFGGTGDPNGVVSATGPAVYIEDDGAGGFVALWSKPDGVTGNTGWV